ncbi:MAG: hypothetical protein KDC38_13110, partial [Planctomycetes bacterium]|nr:hypothetical protein [Planctomycetota bacterium]
GGSAGIVSYMGYRPLVGDMDGDGIQEIIVNDPFQFYSFAPDGSLNPGWPIEIPDFENDGHSCLGDVNGDGLLELIVRSKTCCYTFGVHVIGHDGEPLPGWPVEIDFTSIQGTIGWGFPAVGDLDFDGDDEIVVPTSNGTLAEDFASSIFVFEGDGSLREGWPVFPPPPALIWDRISAIVDLDRDGMCEIVGWSSGSYTLSSALRANGEVYTPYVTSLQFGGRECAVGDVNGNGLLECVFGSTRLQLVDRFGLILATTYALPYVSFQGLSLADIDGDGDLEIAAISSDAGTIKTLHLLDHTLNELPGWPVELDDIGYMPLVDSTIFVDLDNDGDIELIARSDETLYAFDLPAGPGPPKVVWRQRANDPTAGSWYHRDKRDFYLRGDVSGDGLLNVADAPAALSYLFLGTSNDCSAAVDADADGQASIVDPIFVLAYLFSSGPSPATPFPGCAGFPRRANLPCARTSCP